MGALRAVELLGGDVGAGRGCVGGRMFDIGGFAVGVGVATVDEVEDKAGGYGEEDVAGGC